MSGTLRPILDRDLDLLQQWQYELPGELIASRPAEHREDARLMVIDRATGQIAHHTIRELPRLLRTQDLLVFNNTRVLPARMYGFRTATGGKWEGLFVTEERPGRWVILCETRGRLLPGESITIIPAATHCKTQWPIIDAAVPRLVLTLHEKRSDGTWLVELPDQTTPELLLNEFGCLPLPPYMGRRLPDEHDQHRYQTAFASQPGAVAAPTAGLHFTSELLQQCQQRGIHSTELTLHVGIGTFRPVTAARLSDHVMHSEWCSIPLAAAQQLKSTRAAAGRIVAVGTTSVRTLESMPERYHKAVEPWQGRTDIFIRPGHQFQLVDCLLTNFHLPGSTLLVLVAAFSGYDLVMEAYRQAVLNRYRFYSYGDAMLIL